MKLFLLGIIFLIWKSYASPHSISKLFDEGNYTEIKNVLTIKPYLLGIPEVFIYAIAINAQDITLTFLNNELRHGERNTLIELVLNRVKNHSQDDSIIKLAKIIAHFSSISTPHDLNKVLGIHPPRDNSPEVEVPISHHLPSTRINAWVAEEPDKEDQNEVVVTQPEAQDADTLSVAVSTDSFEATYSWKRLVMKVLHINELNGRRSIEKLDELIKDTSGPKCQAFGYYWKANLLKLSEDNDMKMASIGYLKSAADLDHVEARREIKMGEFGIPSTWGEAFKPWCLCPTNVRRSYTLFDFWGCGSRGDPWWYSNCWPCGYATRWPPRRLLGNLTDFSNDSCKACLNCTSIFCAVTGVVSTAVGDAINNPVAKLVGGITTGLATALNFVISGSNGTLQSEDNGTATFP